MRCSTLGCIVTLILSMLVASFAAEGQQATNMHRIGRLQSGHPIAPNPTLEALREGLRDLGYVEGQNLVIEDR